MSNNRFKFRAWDTLKQEMRVEKDFTIDPSIGLPHWIYDDELIQGDCGKRLILMQCIGHKDLSGKDIYEGDIVEEETTKEKYTIVHSGIGFWYKDDEGDNWVLSPSIYKIKVIGNIYETKT